MQNAHLVILFISVVYYNTVSKFYLKSTITLIIAS